MKEFTVCLHLQAFGCEQCKAVMKGLEQQVESLKRMILAGGEVACYRTALKMLGDTWGRVWDCSAHPGHSQMHTAVAAVESLLEGTEKRLCLYPLSSPCQKEHPCPDHGPATVRE